MKKIHAKSPCCRGRIIKFGSRRRQCVICQKTWRVRQKKRGRKSKRVSADLFAKYIYGEIPTSYVSSRIRKGQSKDQRERAIRKSLKRFADNSSWPQLPHHEPLVAIADAMIITIDKKAYTFYFILIRKAADKQAVIAAPYISEETESYEGWREAFAQLPELTLVSINALVCDSHRGLQYIARRKKWIIQQCNFHLIARIQGRRSRFICSQHRQEGERLYQLVNKVITHPAEEAVLDTVREIWELSRQTRSKNLKIYLSGFTRKYWEYRSYLQYPELHLPRTTNSIESLIGSIRKLSHRAHGFRTIESFTLWIDALLKKKKFATCNGSLPTKLMR